MIPQREAGTRLGNQIRKHDWEGKAQNDLIQQTRDFYREHPPDLECITDLTHRHFRVVLPRGRFLKLEDTIQNAGQLQKWLVRLGPRDVFYSTATYLDPTSVRPRPKGRKGYMHPSNILLGHDIAFDVDRQPLSMMNLERARRDALSLLEFMKDRGHPLKYTAFSGSKGFHLVFGDNEWEIVEDPYEREKETIKRRKKLGREVKQAGLHFDSAVLADTRRIIRVPGTLNSKTGYCCTNLTEEQLGIPIRKWLADIPCLPAYKSIPVFRLPRILPSVKKGKRVKAHPRTAIGYTTFLVSSVLGTKGRHAVLMSFPNRSLRVLEKELRNAQARFNLTDLYLFSLPNAIQAVCLNTVQRNRYQKILDTTGSSSANQLRKYNRVSLRMGPLVDEVLRELEPAAEFLTVIECSHDIRERTYASAGHIAFLKRHGLEPLGYPLVHGSGAFKLVDAELRL
ncbi:MAG: hypothetical protein JSW28_00610 [Thermoplasmata archaeon]|nr:MAG: hypothetical protein JSW28_00610 [Thermoplasmata archaeon]